MKPFIKKNFPSLKAPLYSVSRENTLWALDPLATRPHSKFDFILNENIPFAQWNLGGAFSFNYALSQILSFNTQELNKSLNIQSVQGAPPCLWNLDWFATQTIFDPSTIHHWLEAYCQTSPQFKLGLILDFNNPFFTPKLVNDLIGNSLLDALQEHNSHQKNAVSVANDALAKHIRQKFPQIPLHASLNKIVAENGQGNLAYYTKLLEEYARVAIHPQDALNAEFMAQLPEKPRCEITVNDPCLLNCSLRKKHLEALGELRQSPYNITPLTRINHYVETAGCTRPANPLNPAPRSLSLTDNELKVLHDLGFRHFRLQTDALRNEITYLEHLTHFLFTHKPEMHHLIGLTSTTFSTSKIAVPVNLPSGLTPFTFKKFY